MKKWSLIVILITSLLSLSACAAGPNPQSAAAAGTQDQITEEQREALEEAQEAQREAMEEAREAQEEAMEEAREAQQEAQEAMQEAQSGWQEGLIEARKGLFEAQKELKKKGINITLPHITGASFGMSTKQTPAEKLEPVLLIPDRPMDAKILGQLAEDMQVMEMILNEKTAADEKIVVPGTGGGGFFGKSTGSAWIKIFNPGPAGVKSVYLGGYGMIFTLDVDFPLVLIKGAEEKPLEAAQEKKDEVWQRNKERLKGQDQPVEKEQDKEPALVFDQEKVKQLQKDLTEALRHAANIRNLQPREKIVIVVRSVIDGEVLSQAAAQTPEAQPEEPVAVPTSVMTLRADKQDIDAFAADKINLDKFTDKVSVVIY